MFEWDEHNIGHIRRHGVEPHEAEEAAMDPNAVRREAGDYDGEYRETLIGMTRGGRLLVIVDDGERLQVRTGYPATRREERWFFRR